MIVNYESELLKGLRDAINASESTKRIYLVMGHTSGSLGMSFFIGM